MDSALGRRESEAGQARRTREQKEVVEEVGQRRRVEGQVPAAGTLARNRNGFEAAEVLASVAWAA